MTDHGTDIAAITGLDPRFTLVSGRTNLAYALARRLGTPKGGLFYDPSYGLDVRDWLNGELVLSELPSRKALIEAELRQDERVEDVAATLSYTADALEIDLEIEDADGPFSLVLAVTSVTVNVLRIEGATA